jgi:hypothetical protein
MNRDSVSRESIVVDQMDLLGIKDVSTPRQCKNGTVVWRLPIKINYPGNAERFIEVASFKTGYVRNQNCGYSNYQLNKRCDGEPEYFQLDNGDYRKFTTRSCVLIPNEIDRLEYLIAYCLKNYYIKNANQVANGGYVEQWYHDQQLDRNENKYSDKYKTDKLIKLRKEISDLESEARELETKYQSSQAELGRVQEQRDDLQHDLSEQKVRQDVSVIVNGHRYKVL